MANSHRRWADGWDRTIKKVKTKKKNKKKKNVYTTNEHNFVKTILSKKTVFNNDTSIHLFHGDKLKWEIWLANETVVVLMMVDNNMKVKVHSPYGNTDYFDIVVGVQ